MEKVLLIDVVEHEECRVALIENNVLEELYIERSGSEEHVGDIFKAVVTNTEPSIQAAFVDFGAGKNGFLHASDVIPAAWRPDAPKKKRKHPLVQDILRRGQHVVVQLTREGIGKKGASMTTYLSLPGKFIVLMPGIHKHGVSRKIEDEAERERLRKVLEEMEKPKDMGFIVRTAGIGRTKRDLQRDLNHLLRLWKMLEARIEKSEAPALVYQESDLVVRVVRDVFTTDITRAWVNDENAYKKIVDFLKIVMPRAVKKVKLYTERDPLFHKFGIEDKIERIYDRHVPLPEGGSLVIDQAEALVAIDVNSGSFHKEKDPEKSALRVDLAAAKEVVRQLRLRDLGGVIVIDFIDLSNEADIRKVEETMAEGLKRDRARTRMLKMSKFGIIEMTRQRMRSGHKRRHYEDCPYCHGAGQVKTLESMSLRVVREIRASLVKPEIVRADIRVNNRVHDEIQNRMREQVLDIESRTGARLAVYGDSSLGVEDIEIACYDALGNRVDKRS